MVAIDASIAIIIWCPDVPHSVSDARDRVDYLLEELERKNEKILIPSPALAELLVGAGPAGSEFVNEIARSNRFRIGPFDTLAAVEVALQIAHARSAGHKKGKGNSDNWQKVKFDHQIVAISKVEDVSALYTDDIRLAKFARSNGIKVVTLAELPLPPSQTPLFDSIPGLPSETPQEQTSPQQRLLPPPPKK